MNLKPGLIAIAGVIIVLLSACRTKKMPSINYLNDARDSSHMRIWQQYEAKIQPGDKLSIYVTALNPAAAQPYNLSGGTADQGMNVDPQGRILFPQFGFIKAGGLTTNELRDTLLNRLRFYLTDPVVSVSFANFKITILGEVNKQGPIQVPDRGITILEALGEAGDITITGRRDSVLVIRESGGKREFGNLNLLTNEVFKSPFFVLHQNDVVYVPMTKEKAVQKQETFMSRVGPYIALLSSLTSIGWFIFSLTR